MAGLFDDSGRGGLFTLTNKARPRTLLEDAFAFIKRKAFFSFHYDDIMRVNVVRNAWKITHPDSATSRTFYDSSLWESKKLESDDSLKRLIREGVEHTSAICVLVGTDTWWRRWVRYEIARAIIDGRGLLAVHINGIRHHQRGTVDTQGLNPLAYMAIGKVRVGALLDQYYLFEKVPRQATSGWSFEWVRYADYTHSVSRPLWLNDPQPGYVTPLASSASEYDFCLHDGHKNIGTWIDASARQAGR
jgi:hypothetical protein